MGSTPVTWERVNLDERSNMVKCMDEIDSKTIMLDEIHMSMDENGTTMNYLDDKWK